MNLLEIAIGAEKMGLLGVEQRLDRRVALSIEQNAPRLPWSRPQTLVRCHVASSPLGEEYSIATF